MKKVVIHTLLALAFSLAAIAAIPADALAKQQHRTARTHYQSTPKSRSTTGGYHGRTYVTPRPYGGYGYGYGSYDNSTVYADSQSYPTRLVPDPYNYGYGHFAFGSQPNRHNLPLFSDYSYGYDRSYGQPTNDYRYRVIYLR